MIARAIATTLCCCLASTVLAAEDCKPSDPDAFLPTQGQTRPPSNALPDPPTGNDCGFYNWAWHSFLFVTQKGLDGKPDFLRYPTIDQAFPKIFQPQARPAPALSVRNIEPFLENDRHAAPAGLNESGGDPLPVLNDGVMQASRIAGGIGAILVDQNRNPVFYTINVNDAFAQFVQANGLDEIDRLLAAPGSGNAVPAELEFTRGVMELKSAWMIVEGPLSTFSSYITTTAKVPYLKNDGERVVVDTSRPLREVTVALLSLHVVGVIDGHPEFIWATFEHAGVDGMRDIAPAASANPAPDNPTPPIVGADKSYRLFQAGTAPGGANNAATQPVGADQKFAAATSVYRLFPGSKSEAEDGVWEDPSITSLNANMASLFEARDSGKLDLRRNYRLVGAVWIDLPRVNHNFDAGLFFGTDDPRLAGENRLSNMAMESFTQKGAPHCFSCHRTADIGLPNGQSLPARRINVSHILAIAAAKALAAR